MVSANLRRRRKKPIGPADEEAKTDGDEENKCKDSDPVFCKLGNLYCPDQAFRRKCTKTCDMCSNKYDLTKTCGDRFSPFTCARYLKYGWCNRVDTCSSIRLQCPQTCGVCDDTAPPCGAAHFTKATREALDRLRGQRNEALDRLREKRSGAYRESPLLWLLVSSLALWATRD